MKQTVPIWDAQFDSYLTAWKVPDNLKIKNFQLKHIILKQHILINGTDMDW